MPNNNDNFNLAEYINRTLDRNDTNQNVSLTVNADTNQIVDYRIYATVLDSLYADMLTKYPNTAQSEWFKQQFVTVCEPLIRHIHNIQEEE
ncbi:MAG TPA: hypothetical protein DD671_13730 [Balneolaceae bacterium]|jgi:hypothetical protein|nr:hypothetical protein [Balneolaceae bacterium]|tara:strand:+ start:629 stop:901 length:273 start_codon:yes stop_codon:yes gene_type:complete